MALELLWDLAKLAFFVAGAYLALQIWARRREPGWTRTLTQRRLAVLVALTLALSTAKVIEDVLAKESGPVDSMIMGLMREQVPSALYDFFALVTLSGSADFLLPLSAIAVLLLLLARRRFEAVLLGASMLTASLLVYSLKTLVGRDRPSLWEAQSYWGSSFPSGHTLASAAFAVAAAMCLVRIWPRCAWLPMALAMLWASLVALSRLVLGVHWPSDVMAALCLGMLIPLSLSLIFDRELADAP